MSTPAPLTEQQQKVLDYMRVFFALNDHLPSCRSIAGAFGYASPNAADELVRKIAAAGWLEKNEVGRWRFAVWPGFAKDRLANLLAACARAEDFLSGFEDDMTQAEAGSMLGDLRAAMARAREVLA